jgi:heat shock protein HtpX
VPGPIEVVDLGVIEGMMRLLNKGELKAVLAHEIAHVKHSHMVLITLLSLFPLIIYYIAIGLLCKGGGENREGGNPLPLVGLGMLPPYFIV